MIEKNQASRTGQHGKRFLDHFLQAKMTEQMEVT